MSNGTSAVCPLNDKHVHATPGETGTVYGRRRTRAEACERNAALRSLFAGQAVVYAIDTPDGLIKIGHTTDVTRRMMHVPGELIALRPGTYEDEQRIHRSLSAHVHHGREWYHRAPEVMAVVNGMRDDFGLPHVD